MSGSTSSPTIHIEVITGDFLSNNLIPGIEQKVLATYLKSFINVRGVPADWVWHIKVDGKSAEEYIDKGRRAVVNAFNKFVHKQMRRDLGMLRDLLDSYGPNELVFGDIRLPALSDEYLATKEKKANPMFFRKKNIATKEVFSQDVDKVASSDDFTSFEWSSDNAKWVVFNEGDDNQPKRPAILILREYFQESVDSLIHKLNTQPYKTYEDVVRIITAGV